MFNDATFWKTGRLHNTESNNNRFEIYIGSIGSKCYFKLETYKMCRIFRPASVILPHSNWPKTSFLAVLYYIVYSIDILVIHVQVRSAAVNVLTSAFKLISLWQYYKEFHPTLK